MFLADAFCDGSGDRQPPLHTSGSKESSKKLPRDHLVVLAVDFSRFTAALGWLLCQLVSYLAVYIWSQQFGVGRQQGSCFSTQQMLNR